MIILRRKEFGKRYAYTKKEKDELKKRGGSINSVNEDTCATQELINQVLNHPNFRKDMSPGELSVLIESVSGGNAAIYSAIRKGISLNNNTSN